MATPGLSLVLTALAQMCERFEAIFPDYACGLTLTPGGRWEQPRTIEPEATTASAAHKQFSQLCEVIVRLLHRHGEEFNTPLGSITEMSDECSGWSRVLCLAYPYTDSDEVLDLPLIEPLVRWIEINPFLATRLILLEVAGRSDHEDVRDIIASIIRPPSWPRHTEWDWTGIDDEVEFVPYSGDDLLVTWDEVAMISGRVAQTIKNDLTKDRNANVRVPVKCGKRGKQDLIKWRDVRDWWNSHSPQFNPPELPTESDARKQLGREK